MKLEGGERLVLKTFESHIEVSIPHKWGAYYVLKMEPNGDLWFSLRLADDGNDYNGITHYAYDPHWMNNYIRHVIKAFEDRICLETRRHPGLRQLAISKIMEQMKDWGLGLDDLRSAL